MVEHKNFGRVYLLQVHIYKDKVYLRGVLGYPHFARVDYCSISYGCIYEYENTNWDYAVGRMINQGVSYAYKYINKDCWIRDIKPNLLFFINVL